MSIALPAAGRLALAGWLGLVALGAGVSSYAATPPEKSLPDSTLFYVKVANAANLREAFAQSQTGQLINDPAMKPLRDDVMEKMADVSKTLKEKMGVSLAELATLPQGPITIAVVAKSEAKIPVAVLISAEAGKNSATMADVMAKATKLAEGDKAKVSLRFKGREVVHPEIGLELLNRIGKDLEEMATIESEPKFEGRQVIMVLAPRRKKAGPRTATTTEAVATSA